jgi:hypothetical protein
MVSPTADTCSPAIEPEPLESTYYLKSSAWCSNTWDRSFKHNNIKYSSRRPQVVLVQECLHFMRLPRHTLPGCSVDSELAIVGTHSLASDSAVSFRWVEGLAVNGIVKEDVKAGFSGAISMTKADLATFGRGTHLRGGCLPKSWKYIPSQHRHLSNTAAIMAKHMHQGYQALRVYPRHLTSTSYSPSFQRT